MLLQSQALSFGERANSEEDTKQASSIQPSVEVITVSC